MFLNELLFFIFLLRIRHTFRCTTFGIGVPFFICCLKYTECYDLDINAICIEVNTENINSRLYSEDISPKWWHMHNFLLHSEEERRSMFDYDDVYDK